MRAWIRNRTMIRRPRYTSYQNPSLDEPKTTSTSLHPQPPNTQNLLSLTDTASYRLYSKPKTQNRPAPKGFPAKPPTQAPTIDQPGVGCVQRAKYAARLLTHPMPNATPILASRLLEPDFAVDVVKEPL